MELDDVDVAERVRQHFAVRDYWDFMSYNARAQIAALRWFRDHGVSYPGRPGAATMEEWRARLDEMIDGWQAVLDRDDWDADWSVARVEEFVAGCDARFVAGMAVYTRWYMSLWD